MNAGKTANVPRDQRRRKDTYTYNQKEAYFLGHFMWKQSLGNLLRSGHMEDKG